MKILIVLGVVLFLCGSLIYLQQRDHSGSVALTSTQMIRHTDDFEVRFTRQKALADTFMIFGGHVDRKLPNSFSDYSLGALEIGEAALIRQQYPDFHLCKSPGAKVAQRQIRTLSLIIQNPRVANVLEDAIVLHNERRQRGGERTCIELRGQAVEPASVVLRENSEDISGKILPRQRNLHYYLIDSAEIKDCQRFL